MSFKISTILTQVSDSNTEKFTQQKAQLCDGMTYFHWQKLRTRQPAGRKEEICLKSQMGTRVTKKQWKQCRTNKNLVSGKKMIWRKSCDQFFSIGVVR